MHLLMTSCLGAVVLLHVVGAVTPGANAAPGTFVYGGCSPSSYAPNSAFESNLNSLLASITSTASASGATYNSFTAGTRRGAALGTEAAAAVTGDVASSPAYGLYQCRGDLSADECAACVHDTVARLGSVCANARAASLQSEGCYVRYGARDFVVSRADTSVQYRKCSSGTSEDSAFLKARDGVLAQLQDGATTAASPAAGYYNVSTSGTVQGVAQCLGGIAAADCAACLAQAVVQIKGICGDALAADVYLAQCSVRYWANSDYFRSSQGYSEDNVGRTVAIIIGILAGLALFVVFVSFLRKTCG